MENLFENKTDEKEERNHGCDCCQGDEALYWADGENNAFVDSRGDMLTTIKGMTMRYKVKCCPKCGRKLTKENYAGHII